MSAPICTLPPEQCYFPVVPSGEDTLGVTRIDWIAQTEWDTYGLLLGILLVVTLLFTYAMFRYWEPRTVNYVEDTELLAVVNALGGLWPVLPESVDTQPIDLHFEPGVCYS